MKTALTEILEIEYPIIQGGMAWVAEANLAAAVSNAGGLGIIGAGGCNAGNDFLVFFHFLISLFFFLLHFFL